MKYNKIKYFKTKNQIFDFFKKFKLYNKYLNI